MTFPFPHTGGVSNFQPASYVITGTSDNLVVDFSTIMPAATETRVAVSLWVKGSGNCSHLFAIDTLGSFTFFQANLYSTGEFAMFGTPNTSQFEYDIEVSSANPFDSDWHHFCSIFDSTEAVEEDRAKIYIDGALQTDTHIKTISLNEDSGVFSSVSAQRSVIIGFSSSARRIAFVDFVHGSSVAVTDFGFDDSGTWTRKPFTGSRGVNGFSLDGTAGLNTSEGLALAFDDASGGVPTLDFTDLPPYT